MRRRLRPPISHTLLEQSITFCTFVLAQSVRLLIGRCLVYPSTSRLVSLLTLFLCIATLILVPVLPAAAREVPFFIPNAISTSANNATTVHIADINHDGTLDVVTGTSDRVLWHNNRNGRGSNWRTSTIDSSTGANAVMTADIEWDGDLDVIAASDSGVVWYDNDSDWTKTQIVATGASSVSPADIDGNDTVDVIAAHDNSITWYENTVWTATDVDSSNGANAIAAADVDNDGDLDVLAATDNAIVWYRNNGSGAFSSRRTISSAVKVGTSVYAADINGDGDIDVVSASRNDAKIAWYENKGSGSFRTQKVISSSMTGATSVYARDVDSDGDMDVLSASSTKNVISWHENTAADGNDWKHYSITKKARNVQAVVAADIDDDGDMDVLSASSADDKIAWYRNDTIHRSGFFPEETFIHTTAGARSVASADIDGDGHLDVLSAANSGNAIFWHRNSSGDGSTWDSRRINKSNQPVSQAATVNTADVDNDGDLDVLATALGDGKITWYENGNSWRRTVIGSLDGADTIYPADMDQDGDLDILVGSGVDTVTWYENVNPKTASWTEHEVTGSSQFNFAYPSDIDNDGDIDVIAVYFDRYHGVIAFFRNDGGGTTWSTENIATNLDGAASAYPADVDNDGDLDVFATAYFARSVRWYENKNGIGTSWTGHEINPSSDGASSVYGADVDNDGDMDAVASSQRDSTVAWFENVKGNGSEWIGRFISNRASVPLAVNVGDIDNDGDMDALSASIRDSKIAWYENRGGQFALATTDNAPGSIASGQFDDVLRIDMFHRGRSRDHDTELVTLDLLFEEGDDDPLTTEEAARLFTHFYIYRDDDGSEVFEPLNDRQVAAIESDDFALSNGVHTFRFRDGDPNVRVPFDTSKTYFVVVQLAIDADSYTPDQFRITHLTEGSSTGQDRANDIPLILEFVANTSSSIVQIVPNDAPAITTNTGATIPEAGTVIITNTLLEATDNDTGPDSLIFTLETMPLSGTLYLDFTPLGVGSTFTQEDINTNRLRYLHNGRENADTDRFIFTVRDSFGKSSDRTAFDITATSRNDAPVLVANAGATVNEAESVIIDDALLSVIDTDSDTDQIVYTLTTIPLSGTLFKDNEPLAVGDSFTQEDIDSNRVRYTHDGGEDVDTDAFTFTVEDADGSIIEETPFDITIIAQNDAPVIEINDGLVVKEGAINAITNTVLLVSDDDHDPADLIYTLETTPTSGILLNEDVLLAVGDTFTQDDVDNLHIRYEHNGSNSLADVFDFTVSDVLSGTTPTSPFSITIVSQNDAPLLTNLTIATFAPNEALPIMLRGRIVDDDPGDTFTLVVDWGDGTPAQIFEYGPGTAAFTETYQYSNDGIYTISLVLTDAEGAQAFGKTGVTIVNLFPVVANTIPDQKTMSGDMFTFTFAENTFADIPADILSYSATLEDGSALPSWLAFDAATRTFSGTPDSSDVGSIRIAVTASDDQGATATATFTLTVTAPQLAAFNQAYLPIMLKGGEEPIAQGTPDLVGSISIAPDKRTFDAGEDVLITVVITNQGTADAGPFWADLYINPSGLPAVNNRWDEVCGLTPCHGIAWAVSQSLEPGESIILTSTPDSYASEQTIWPGWFADGTSELYLLVDSWNPGVATGAVDEEAFESNNLSQLGELRVVGENPPTLLTQAQELPERPALR